MEWRSKAVEVQSFRLPVSPRSLYNLNHAWKFYQPLSNTWPLATALEGVKDSQGNNFYDVDYEDSHWTEVSLPHTFNDVDSFKSIANDAGDMGVYRGITFYRKTFTLPAADIGKKVFIEFEGIRQAAYVYLNGVMVGFYEAGVAPFGFDLTNYVKFGELNVLAVATDNTSSRGMSQGKYLCETRPGTSPGSNTGVEFQWNTKDFNPIMGGLTRNVRLHVKGKVYQTLPLYSNLKTKGLYVYAADIDVNARTAVINVESEVRNETDSSKKLSLEVIITNHKGEQVYKFASPKQIVKAAQDIDQEFMSIVPWDAYEETPTPTDTASRDAEIIKCSAKVENLQLWSPDYPYLYQIYAILKDGDQVLDVEQITTGFRKLEVRGGKDGGVFINDRFYWLTGYAQRSSNEWAVIGIAPDWLRDYDAQLIKESNANFIRWMHIAAQPADIRAGDKFGIVSVQPAGDKEREPHGRQWDQRVETMRDVIIYFRNSPSIMFWEAGNSAISAEHMREMVQLRKTLDPYGRPMGCRSLEEEAALAEAEWVGTMLGRRVRDRQGYTEKGELIRDKCALVETEYSRDESPRRVWDDFSPPDFDYINVFTGSNGAKENYKDAWDLTAEDFVVSHTDAYYEFYSRRMQADVPTPYYSAAAAMIWSDSNQHGRLQATENCRMSGRVDPIRIKKQSFYAFQTMQSKEPAVYLVGHWNYPTDPDAYIYQVKDPLSHRYTGDVALRDAANKTVYVIGSPHISRVELCINGKSFGSAQRTRNAFLYEFSGVNIMQPGYIEAIGYAANSNEIVRHKIETVGKPVRIKLTPVVGPEGLRADGSDIAFVDVEVVDACGRVHPLDYERIDFALSGPAEFLGGYNSGVKDLGHDCNYVYAECGVNRVFIRSTRQAGIITLRAFRADLPTAIVTIESKPFTVDESGLTKIMPQVIIPNLEESELISSSESMSEITNSAEDKTGVFTSDRTSGREEIRVFVNERQVDFGKNLSAYCMVGVYGPAFALLDILGLEYNYEEETQKLTVKHDGNVVETRVADSDMYVNGVPGTINDWPEIIDGVLHIEISAVIPALGLKTYWGTDGKSYYIITK